MRTLTTAGLIAFAAAGVLGCSPGYSAAPATVQDYQSAAGDPEFRWRGQLAPGQQVEVKGVNGRITAVAAEGEHVDVRARNRARKSDPASVRIQVVKHENGVTICAVYPTPAGRRPNECRPGDGGRNNVRDNDVKVDFTVAVPAGVHLAARTVNGDVEVGELSGDVSVKTVNGDVEVERSRRARAQTVNGSITARITEGRGTDPLEFETVNGGITLYLPPNLGAELRARTVNGGIDSDFPLMVKGRISRRKISATIGDGGPELRLSTVNGSIRLRRTDAT